MPTVVRRLRLRHLRMVIVFAAPVALSDRAADPTPMHRWLAQAVRSRSGRRSMPAGRPGRLDCPRRWPRFAASRVAVRARGAWSETAFGIERRPARRVPPVEWDWRRRAVETRSRWTWALDGSTGRRPDRCRIRTASPPCRSVTRSARGRAVRWSSS